MRRIPGVTHYCALSHPDLQVFKTQAGHKIRTLYQITGIMPDSPLGINNGDIDTLATAMLTRVFYCKVGNDYIEPPKPDMKYINQSLRKFQKQLCSFTTTPLDLEEVVACYKGRKNKIYSNALDNLHKFGLSWKHAVSCSFVKVEKVKVTSAPRVIQPRRPEYNLELGRYIKKIEHRLYRKIAKIFGDGPTVIKGYDVNQAGNILHSKWKLFTEPVAVSLDAEKFDMHVSAEMLSWEHQIYLHVYRQCLKLKMLLRWQMHNRGKGSTENGRIKYRVTGKRFSGDMNTALGNCIIMCAMVWSYANNLGIKIALANNGDDCVVFMERKDLGKFTSKLSESFIKWGFRMTIEKPVYEFEEIEFCQMHPIKVSSGYRMVRNIGVALTKDTLSTLGLDNEIIVRKWMYAIGECGLALSSGVPILQNFYSMYKRWGIPSKMHENHHLVTGMSLMRKDMESMYSKIEASSRLSVFKAWGITPDEQVELEKQFDSMEYEHIPSDINYHSYITNVLPVPW